MSFIGRHKFSYSLGILTFMLNFWQLHLRPTDLQALLSAVLTLAATLTAIFIGFVSIILSLKENALFRRMFLDLRILESLLLGTTFYLLVSFASIFGFFIPNRFSGLDLFMSVWLSFLSMAVEVTVSLVVQLFEVLHGLWVERDNENLYK
ncbi:hypothetical protein [Lacticaseibacillus paracasei]|uniref:hypothetical protein n=1 Tax=Lacticaseibacillus paracasei TaxID=1597 RepID=UPI004046197C